jgi:hypothetical protein
MTGILKLSVIVITKWRTLCTEAQTYHAVGRIRDFQKAVGCAKRF